MTDKQWADDITIEAIYSLLSETRFVLGGGTSSDIGKLVLRDPNKEPNYILHKEMYNGIEHVYMEIKDLEYENKRTIVKNVGKFLGIELEQFGDTVSNFMKIFTLYSDNYWNHNKTFLEFALDNSSAYDYDKWVKWIDDFSGRMMLDPIAMKIDIEEFVKTEGLMNGFAIMGNIDRIKKFISKILNC